MEKITKHLQQFIDVFGAERNPFTTPKFHKFVPVNLTERWKNWGFNVVLDEFNAGSYTGRNVMVLPKNIDKPCVIILAHHDTVPDTPGIDDNCSGMAVLDYLLFYFRNNLSKYNIMFAMVDFEEGDPKIWEHVSSFLNENNMESYADLTNIDKNMHFKYQNHLYKHLTDIKGFRGTHRLVDYLNENNLNVDFVIDFETVGYKSDNQETPAGIPLQLDKGDFHAIIGNFQSQSWIDDMMKTGSNFIPLIVPNKGKDMTQTRRSDHAVFWDLDIAAVMITDTANYRNPNYHRPSDTQIDYHFMGNLINSMIKFLES